jgi:hypothetical protein
MGKYPHVMYVLREADGDEHFFSAQAQLKSFAVPDDKIVVAKYVLESFVTVTANVSGKEERV